MSSKRKFRRQNQLAPLQQKVLSMGLGKEVELQPNNGSRESMSDALSNVIDIYRDTADNLATFEKLVTLGSIAWNACASEPEDGQKLLETFYAEVRKSGSRQDLEDARILLEELMARKRELYPNNRRIIVNFTVQESRSQYHLQVASTLEAMD